MPFGLCVQNYVTAMQIHVFNDNAHHWRKMQLYIRQFIKHQIICNVRFLIILHGHVHLRTNSLRKLYTALTTVLCNGLPGDYSDLEYILSSISTVQS